MPCCNNDCVMFAQVSPARATLFVEGRDRTLSFHERATSKDVIDELNRMIRKGEDHTTAITNNESQVVLEKLDLACCCPTGWVHVERDIDFTDPKVSFVETRNPHSNRKYHKFKRDS